MKALFSLYIVFSHTLWVHSIPLQSKDNLRHGTLTVQENEQLQRNCGYYGGRESKSYGSRRASREEAPWVVGVALFDDNNNATLLFCSATLISNRHVLTALHCLKPYSVDKIRFVFDDDCGGQGYSCSIENATIRKANNAFSPYERHGSGSNDLIIFELDEPIDISRDIYPACLLETSPHYRDVLELFSFGTDRRLLESNITLAGSLQHINVTSIPCYRNISLDSVCLRSNYMGPDHGDSGGGFVYKKNNRIYVSVIVSGGHIITYGYMEEHHTAVAHHLHWICWHTGICVDETKAAQIDMPILTYIQ